MNLWNLGVDLENVKNRLNQIKNLLQVYEECLEEELSTTEKHKDEFFASYFSERYDLLRSLLGVTQLHLINTSSSLQSQIDSIFEAYRVENKIGT